MGRTLKRVPLDFNWPINKIWYGYYNSFCTDAHEYRHGGCESCREFARIKGIPLTSYECPDTEPILGPPKGEGYQLWETTSKGSPQSPVFETLDELCEWCETNATTFGSFKAGKAEWKQMLSDDFVVHKEGNAIFF